MSTSEELKVGEAETVKMTPYEEIDRLIGGYFAKSADMGLQKMRSEFPELHPEYDPVSHLCRFNLRAPSRGIARLMDKMIIDTATKVIVYMHPAQGTPTFIGDALKMIRECKGDITSVPIFEGINIYVYYHNDHWAFSTDDCLDASKDMLDGKCVLNRFRSLFDEDLDEMNKNYSYTYVVHDRDLLNILRPTQSYLRCIFKYDLENNKPYQLHQFNETKDSISEKLSACKCVDPDRETMTAEHIGLTVNYGGNVVKVFKQYAISIMSALRVNDPSRICRVPVVDLIIGGIKDHTISKIAYFFPSLNQYIKDIVSLINTVATKTSAAIARDSVQKDHDMPLLTQFIRETVQYKRMVHDAVVYDVPTIVRTIMADGELLSELMGADVKARLKKLK